MIQCTKCKYYKNPDQFTNRGKKINGKHSWCKECCRINQLKYNKEKRKQRFDFETRLRSLEERVLKLEGKYEMDT